MMERLRERKGVKTSTKEEVSLKVTSMGKGVVKICWNLSANVQADELILERSLKDTAFETIQIYQADAKVGEYTDNGVPSGFNYYRVRAVNKNTTVEYRKVKVVYCS